MTRPLRLLIVDDSDLVREAIKEIVADDPEIEVVGEARDGRAAAQRAAELRPDVITMDVQMPVMGGLEAIEQIMSDTPTPILVVTGDPRVKGGEMNFEALRRGALDVMEKPQGWWEDSQQPHELRDRIKLLAGVAVVRHASRPRPQAAARGPSPAPADDAPRRADESAPRRRVPPTGPALAAAGAGQIVAIVSSTGGPVALAHILECLPGDFPAPIVIVQHIASGFAGSLASWLDDVSPLRVRLASPGDALAPGTVLLAPDGVHMTVSEARRVTLSRGNPIEGHLPSGTLLLSSVADVFGRQAVGMILTGMGRDGVDGLEEIRRAGGTTLAQDEGSCVVYGMPKAARESGAALLTVALENIARTLRRVVGPTAASDGPAAPKP